MNKWIVIAAVLFLTETIFSQTARTYFDEIYKAGGLDRVADGYVCFDDDSALSTFFIFGKSDTIKQFLESVGGYGMPNSQRKRRRSSLKDFLQFAVMTKGFRYRAKTLI